MKVNQQKVKLLPARGCPAFNSGDFSALLTSGVVHVNAVAAGARRPVRGSAELACMLLIDVAAAQTSVLQEFVELFLVDTRLLNHD